MEYDFHAEGESTLVESVDGDLEVQILVESEAEILRGTGSQGIEGVSYITEVATEIDGNRVVLDSDDNQLSINGTITEFSDGDSFDLGDGSLTYQIADNTSSFIINYSDGEQLTIDRQSFLEGELNYFDVDFTPSGTNELVGLLGDNDGNPKGVLPESSFVTGSAATNDAHRFIFDDASGELLFDIDGSGTQSPQSLATVTGVSNLSAGDIQLM